MSPTLNDPVCISAIIWNRRTYYVVVLNHVHVHVYLITLVNVITNIRLLTCTVIYIDIYSTLIPNSSFLTLTQMLNIGVTIYRDVLFALDTARHYSPPAPGYFCLRPCLLSTHTRRHYLDTVHCCHSTLSLRSKHCSPEPSGSFSPLDRSQCAAIVRGAVPQHQHGAGQGPGQDPGAELGARAEGVAHRQGRGRQ